MTSDIYTATYGKKTTLTVDDIYEAMRRLPDKPLSRNYTCSAKMLEKIKEEYTGEYTELDANHIMINGAMIKASLLMPDDYILDLDELERQTRQSFYVPYKYL